MLNSEQLLRLRSYVDEVLSLIDAIDAVIRVPDLDTDAIDPSDGLAIVKRLHLNRKRAGAPGRRRSAQ